MFYNVFLFLNKASILSVSASLRQKFDDVRNSSYPAGGEEAFADLVKNIYEFAFPLAMTVSIILLVFGAYKLITSAGNPEKLNEAREVITNAIMGVVMIGLGLAALALIAGEIGVPTN